MKYDITKSVSPTMPRLGKGTECIKILLSQVSKDIQEPLVPLLFPSLGAHISVCKFQYPDRTWKEPCGIMANLVAESGGNKGQLTHLIEAICHDFRLHDITNAAFMQNAMALEMLDAKTFTPRQIRLIVDYLGEP